MRIRAEPKTTRIVEFYLSYELYIELILRTK
jgi:hypothetical protein